MGQTIATCSRLSDVGVSCRPKAGCVKSCPQGLNDQQVSNILLIQSTIRGDVDDVKRAIQMGAMIDTTSQIALKVGASSIDDEDRETTPLMIACQMGYQDVAEVLVRKKAYLLATDDRGWTPLCYAFSAGHVAIARLLTLPDICQTVIKLNKQKKKIREKRGELLETVPTEKQTAIQEEIDAFLDMEDGGGCRESKMAFWPEVKRDQMEDENG